MNEGDEDVFERRIDEPNRVHLVTRRFQLARDFAFRGRLDLSGQKVQNQRIELTRTLYVGQVTTGVEYL